jgi:phosphoribosylformylglycinamidine cyclo-ligase
MASFGQATYEKTYNSGIGSNGLTSARHDILDKYYAENYKESYDNNLPEEVVYIGENRIKNVTGILSPTRTYAPLIKKILETNFDKISGLIHCSGGGQTKCLKYIPENVRVIKDNLFTPPDIFNKIKLASKSDDREMYQVFNMGCRMEIYTDEDFAATIIHEARSFNIEAQIIGHVESSGKKQLLIDANGNELVFS